MVGTLLLVSCILDDIEGKKLVYSEPRLKNYLKWRELCCWFLVFWMILKVRSLFK